MVTSLTLTLTPSSSRIMTSVRYLGILHCWNTLVLFVRFGVLLNRANVDLFP